MFRLGIERLTDEEDLKQALRGRRCAFLGHHASVDRHLRHSLSRLIDEPDIDIVCAFGPQHGMRGEKQDNMIESEDYVDPHFGLPVYSLYGATRRIPERLRGSFDVLLVDLQDIGSRVYTYLTTLAYVLEDLSASSPQGEQSADEVWVLDRPNPAGRLVEGHRLQDGWESFIGAMSVPMRHGLTLGELAEWYVRRRSLDVKLRVVPMTGYRPEEEMGSGVTNSAVPGWPAELPWVNPSPNIPEPVTAQLYSGTVLFEGTTLSEGRGTTKPFHLFGAPELPADALLSELQSRAPQLCAAARMRELFFEPTFEKQSGRLCRGLQFHLDYPEYEPQRFRPYRLVALALGVLREWYPDWAFWREPPFEYEYERMPIDLLAGGPRVRQWVEGSEHDIEELEAELSREERAWESERRAVLRY